ncbi:MAG: RluA family pseudouridine synthase, partial [Lachnospiraceae bacterium]|nr:RluA family pseudouridine synthase [Candidatus Minthocola equi]
MTEEILYPDISDEGMRLDVYLSDRYDEMSRSYLQRLIKEGNILIGGQSIKAGYKLRGGEEITVVLPDPEVLDIVPENIPLDIVYEDDDLIFVNKPKGMVVHPGAGHMTGTLVNALMYHCGDSLSGINGVLRPGIVHRIDKDTSGIIVACKNDNAHREVAKQLACHSVTRTYYAIACGNIDSDGTVDAPIARAKNNRQKMAVDPMGKRAVTHYHVIQNLNGYSYISCNLETGRTHQIRVHMNHINHPLYGDTVYGNRPCKHQTDGQCLHAGVLGLIHSTTKEYIEFKADIPDYFEHLLTLLQ